MSNAGCATCRLRFTRADAAHLSNCPLCAQPVQQFANLEQIIGFRLHKQEPSDEPARVAISLPDPRHHQP